MHDDPEFEPLRPRRRVAEAAEAPPEVAVVSGCSAIPSDDAPRGIAVSSGLSVPAPAADVAPREEIVELSEDALDIDDRVSDHDSRARVDDEEERHAALREEAIRFAAIACARALRRSVEGDAGDLTRYVDEALRACGRVGRAVIRLHPSDAASYRPSRDADVVADASLARGAVVVETDAGSLGATIEERALLLARAAAHA